MATGGSGLGSSIKGSDEYCSIIGSDEYHANVCSPCERDGKQNGTDTYCMECEEYLCTNCLASHNRLAKLRTHTIVNQATLQNPQTFQTAPVLSEGCDKHHGRLIDTYCKAHDAVCCSVCVDTEHKLCSIRYIPHVAAGIKTNEQYKSLQQSMNTLRDDQDRLYVEKQEELESLNKEVFDAKAISQITKKRLVKLLNEMEERTIGEIEAKHERCKLALESDIEKLQKHREAIDKRLEKLESVTDNAEAFVLLKKGQEQRSCGTLVLSELEAAPQQTINFKVTDGLDDLLACYTTLGTVMADLAPPAHDQVYTVAINKTPCITSELDSAGTCSIMGCCMLPDSTILLADWENKSLKRLDSVYNIIDILQMPNGPSDVCGIGLRVAAVSIQWMKQIHLVSTSLPMTGIKHFDISEPCRGIAYHNQVLYLACGGGSGGGKLREGPGQIQVYTISGTPLMTYKTDSRSEPLFKTPYNIAVSSITNQLHVCDNTHGLITLDSDGNKLWTFTDRELNYANGVCTDEHGQVFVCGFRSGNVFLLSRDGRKLCKLIGRGSELEKVKSLIYDEVHTQLVVCMQQMDKILVYDLQTRE